MSSLTEKDLRRHLNNFDWQARAALWKRCAKNYAGMKAIDEKHFNLLCDDIDKTSSELEALKNNARICALGLQHVNEHYNVRVPHDAAMAAERILEATKEVER